MSSSSSFESFTTADSSQGSNTSIQEESEETFEGVRSNNINLEKKENYLDRPSTDRDVLGLKEYVTDENDNKKIIFDKKNLERDIENIRKFYDIFNRYSKKYIKIRKKFLKKDIDATTYKNDLMKLKCCRPECPGGTGVVFGKHKKKDIINNKFIIKQNELTIIKCSKCDDKVYKKQSYGYLYKHFKENKMKIDKIKLLLSIQKNELANDLFKNEEDEEDEDSDKEETDDLTIEQEIYQDFRNYYLKKDEHLKIIEKKMLVNKKNVTELTEQLKIKMIEYKTFSGKIGDTDRLKSKIKLYNEILQIKEEIRKGKYDKINNHDNIILQINEDITFNEINDITEDDDEISIPYIEIKKNIYNIPDSLQIIIT